MKKISFTLLIIASLFSLKVQSQNCAACSTTDTISTSGFINLDSIPCIMQGTAYDYAIPLSMFNLFYVAALTRNVNIDSITFVDIINQPCGLCWSTSKASNTFAANENACIRISGTSNDAVGQYSLGIELHAYFKELPDTTEYSQVVPPYTVAQSGIQLILRVTTPSGACNTVDTSSSAHNNTASCAEAVNNIPGNISLFEVYPNPVNSGSVVSFSALEGGLYTLRLTDIMGKTLSSQQIPASVGINKTNLSRQGLAAGIYFISVGNEHGIITKKLLVTD